MHARPCIEKYPLQVYISAILFAPVQSIIQTHFESDVRPLWILQSGQVSKGWRPLIQTLEGHTAAVWHVEFSPDGTRLASASRDRTFRVETGAAVRTLKGHSDWVRHAAFSPDGTRLASASEDMTVRVWDVETGAAVHTLEGHSDWVRHVAFSPDGTRLASVSEDRLSPRGDFRQNLSSPS